MLVKSKEDITPVLVNLYAILSWNKYYNMTKRQDVQSVKEPHISCELALPIKYDIFM